ncbi:hypothetical protein Tco_0169614 [Tanacetum coccineum]
MESLLVKYVADILKKFDFLSIRTATTPIESNKPLVKDEDGVDVDEHVYRSMIGSLMYLTASRPDITFAVCACARFQVTPKASYLNVVKRIFRKLISWQCKKQTIVANSTTEAKYDAAANCCGQVLWIQNQMMDYGFNFMNTKIHIDNEGTISTFSLKDLMSPGLTSKWGYTGDIVPLLPAMLAGAAMDQGEGSVQPAEPYPTPIDPLPSTSLPHQSPLYSPHQSPLHSPHQSLAPQPAPVRGGRAPLPEGNTSGSAEASIKLKELMVLIPSLVTRVTSLEKELKDTKQTLGNAMLKLVKKVKSLEKALKRKSKKVIVSASEDFVTLGEAQEEEISPIILEAVKTLSKVASQSVSKAKSTDKGKRYRRRARSMAKKINTGLDAEDEINTSRVEINTVIKDVNTGSTKVDTGRREGKAQMVEEGIQATHKTKEQIRQEEAGLEEAIRFQAQMDEEVAKYIHLDKMLAKRVLEEQELSEQQLKRKVEVQKAA